MAVANSFQTATASPRHSLPDCGGCSQRVRAQLRKAWFRHSGCALKLASTRNRIVSLPDCGRCPRQVELQLRKLCLCHDNYAPRGREMLFYQSQTPIWGKVLAGVIVLISKEKNLFSFKTTTITLTRTLAENGVSLWPNHYVATSGEVIVGLSTTMLLPAMDGA